MEGQLDALRTWLGPESIVLLKKLGAQQPHDVELLLRALTGDLRRATVSGSTREEGRGRGGGGGEDEGRRL